MSEKELFKNAWVNALSEFFYTAGYKDGYKKAESNRPPMPLWLGLSYLVLVPLSTFCALLVLGSIFAVVAPH